MLNNELCENRVFRDVICGTCSLSSIISLSRFYNARISYDFTGRKAGKGIFTYEAGVKDRPENPGALELLKKYSLTPQGR